MAFLKRHHISWTFIGIVTIFIILICSLIKFLAWGRPTNQVNDRSESIPTLYMHGYGAGARSSNGMIAYASNHQGATKVLTARIDSDGHVTLSGKWPKGTRHPLIQVLQMDNTYYNYHVTSKWFYNLIILLQRRYHIRRYNTISHSMGNITTMFYQVKYGHNTKLPKLNKQVNIAGHFDGIIGIDDKVNRNYFLQDGKPRYINSYYKYLLNHRHGYPSGVKILNVFGNLENGSNSDGDVTNISARSLKYLLRDKYMSYQEIEIKGKGGQHSQLHENSQVDRYIGNFLWKNK